MNTEELIRILRIASESVNDKPALAMLLLMAAEKIEGLSSERTD